MNGSQSSLDSPQLATGTNHSRRSALHVAASSANPSARSSAYIGVGRHAGQLKVLATHPRLKRGG